MNLLVNRSITPMCVCQCVCVCVYVCMYVCACLCAPSNIFRKTLHLAPYFCLQTSIITLNYTEYKNTHLQQILPSIHFNIYSKLIRLKHCQQCQLKNMSSILFKYKDNAWLCNTRSRVFPKNALYVGLILYDYIHVQNRHDNGMLWCIPLCFVRMGTCWVKKGWEYTTISICI